MKICDKAKYQNRHSSKSIRLTKLFFCQNDVLMGGLFWQKDSLITHILFEYPIDTTKNPMAVIASDLLHHTF